MRPDEPDQAGQRNFRVRKLKHSCHAQEFLLTWSCKLTPSPREMVMGESPPEVRGIGESMKQTLDLG